MNRLHHLLIAALALVAPAAALGQAAPTYQGQDGQTKEAVGTFCADATRCGGGGSGGSVPTGTAGSPNAAVVTVQGITNGTPLPVTGPLTDAQARATALPVFAAAQASAADGASNASYARAVTSGGGTNNLGVYGFVYDPTATAWQRQRGDQVGSYVVETPTASANNAIVPGSALGVTSLVLKASAGNFYGSTITAGSAAGFLVVANLAAAPASGTALTAAQVLYCVPVAASGVATAGSGAGIPDRASVGITLLFSTACATYTPVATAAVHLRGRAL